MYIDSHCHLTDKRYTSVKDVVDTCRQNGTGILVDVGWNRENSFLARDNAQSFDGVYFAAGIHPSEANVVTQDDVGAIETLLSHPKCIALGEIGLDYHYDDCDRSRQIRLFEAQLDLLKKHDLPVIIHSRDASNDLYQVLKSNANLLKNGFLMHCYSESLEQAKRYLDLGGYFAFGGVITFKNSKKDDIVRAIPLDRLMAETDAPYMTPVPFRGQLNTPDKVMYVYDHLAKILSVEGDLLQDVIEKNFRTFFKKVSL